jgi:hypothetical protein
VAAEALALFAIPGAGYAISGRLGLCWISSSAINGSLAGTSFRGVQDVARGEFSGATVYIFDAVTGAVIAVLIGGTFVLVGKGVQGTAVALDDLATRGLHRSEVTISDRLSKAASASPKGLDTAAVARDQSVAASSSRREQSSTYFRHRAFLHSSSTALAA